MPSLQELLDNIKLFEKETLEQGLADKPLRLCIDGKQIVEIRDIEVISRGRDLTLFVTSSRNVGYSPSEGDKTHGGLREQLEGPLGAPLFNSEETLEEAPKVITQQDLIETFNKKKDGKADNNKEDNAEENTDSENRESA